MGFKPKSQDPCSFSSPLLPPSHVRDFLGAVVPQATMMSSGYIGLVTSAFQPMPTISCGSLPLCLPPLWNLDSGYFILSQRCFQLSALKSTLHEQNKGLPLGCEIRATRKTLSASWTLVIQILLFYQLAKYFHPSTEIKWCHKEEHIRLVTANSILDSKFTN